MHFINMQTPTGICEQRIIEATYSNLIAFDVSIQAYIKKASKIPKQATTC